MPSLELLDIRFNYISDIDFIDEVLVKIKNLKVIYMQKNPILINVPHCKRIIVSKCRKLTFFNDKPITDEDRKLADVTT